MDRSTKQKINKETQTLSDTIDQLDLIDIYRTFHPTTMNFTFFSSTHGTFSRIDNILGHKSTLKSESESEVTQSCPTLCDPMDCSLLCSSVCGILQERILEWVAISFSRRSTLVNSKNRKHFKHHF